jgi:hypothetical protein
MSAILGTPPWALAPGVSPLLRVPLASSLHSHDFGYNIGVVGLDWFGGGTTDNSLGEVAHHVTMPLHSGTDFSYVAWVMPNSGATSRTTIMKDTSVSGFSLDMYWDGVNSYHCDWVYESVTISAVLPVTLTTDGINELVHVACEFGPAGNANPVFWSNMYLNEYDSTGFLANAATTSATGATTDGLIATWQTAGVTVGDTASNSSTISILDAMVFNRSDIMNDYVHTWYTNTPSFQLSSNPGDAVGVIYNDTALLLFNPCVAVAPFCVRAPCPPAGMPLTRTDLPYGCMCNNSQPLCAVNQGCPPGACNSNGNCTATGLFSHTCACFAGYTGNECQVAPPSYFNASIAHPIDQSSTVVYRSLSAASAAIVNPNTMLQHAGLMNGSNDLIARFPGGNKHMAVSAVYQLPSATTSREALWSATYTPGIVLQNNVGGYLEYDASGFYCSLDSTPAPEVHASFLINISSTRYYHVVCSLDYNLIFDGLSGLNRWFNITLTVTEWNSDLTASTMLPTSVIATRVDPCSTGTNCDAANIDTQVYMGNNADYITPTSATAIVYDLIVWSSTINSTDIYNPPVSATPDPCTYGYTVLNSTTVWGCNSTASLPTFFVNPCINNTCAVNGVCVPDSVLTYHCQCANGAQGDKCQYTNACLYTACDTQGNVVPRLPPLNSSMTPLYRWPLISNFSRQNASDSTPAGYLFKTYYSGGALGAYGAYVANPVQYNTASLTWYWAPDNQFGPVAGNIGGPEKLSEGYPIMPASWGQNLTQYSVSIFFKYLHLGECVQGTSLPYSWVYFMDPAQAGFCTSQTAVNGGGTLFSGVFLAQSTLPLANGTQLGLLGLDFYNNNATGPNPFFRDNTLNGVGEIVSINNQNVQIAPVVGYTYHMTETLNGNYRCLYTYEYNEFGYVTTGRYPQPLVSCATDPGTWVPTTEIRLQYAAVSGNPMWDLVLFNRTLSAAEVASLYPRLYATDLCTTAYGCNGCRAMYSNYTCTSCKAGWSGFNCDYYNPCAAGTPCGAYGTCHNPLNGTFTCSCDTVHGGTLCNNAICNTQSPLVDNSTCSCVAPFYSTVYGRGSQLGVLSSTCDASCVVGTVTLLNGHWACVLPATAAPTTVVPTTTVLATTIAPTPAPTPAPTTPAPTTAPTPSPTPAPGGVAATAAPLLPTGAIAGIAAGGGVVLVSIVGVLIYVYAFPATGAAYAPLITT